MSDDPFDPTREAAGAPRPEDDASCDPEEEQDRDGSEDELETRERRGPRRHRRRHRRRARKERILHTRVSEQLSDDIRQAAEDLRLPVSNLVRNVLEEAFGAVERVSEEVGDLLDEVLGEAEDIRDDLSRRRRSRRDRAARARRVDPVPPKPPAPPEPVASAPAGAPPPPAASTRAAPGRPGAGAHMSFPDVLGWQPLLVNGSRECACGERTLAPGDDAFVAVTDHGLSGDLLCAACMRARGSAG